jgi:methionine-rich copper-binding protein CopC
MIRQAAVLCAVLLAASGAAAHPIFVSASPARGAVVAVAPKTIRVSFSEAVLAPGSSFQLLDAAGKAMRTGPLALAPKDNKTVVLPIAQPLAPGAYTVRWKVLAAGHSAVPGLYRFRLRR